MNNVLAFKAHSSHYAAPANQQFRDNIVSLADWKSNPRPKRTSAGVFYISPSCGHSGDAA